MKTINMTFKMEESEVVNFENWFRQQQQVIDFKILPDTETLYQKDEYFKKLVKGVKVAQRLRDEYINNYNH